MNINPYPDFRWWMGVVEDRNDPKQLGRVRVRIFGIHSPNVLDIPTETLPWAATIRPVSSANTTGIGGFTCGLVEGSHVVGFFMDGDACQIPVIMGSIAGIPEQESDPTVGFNDQRPESNPVYDGQLTLKESPRRLVTKKLNNIDKADQYDGKGNQLQEENGALNEPGDPPLNDGLGSRYPLTDLLGEPDTDRLARNVIQGDFSIQIDKSKSLHSNIDSATGISWDEPSPPSQAVFPFNKTITSESGHAVEMDDTPGVERIHVYHRTGSFIEFHPNGTIVQKTFADAYDLVARNQKVHVDGTSDITIDKGASVFVNRDNGNPVTSSDLNFDYNVRLGEEANFNITIDGAAEENTKGNLKIRINKTGGIQVIVTDGDIDVTQIKGDIKIVQQDGNMIHSILNGNYTIDVPNGGFVLNCRDPITMRSNTAINIVRVDTNDPTPRIQSRITVTDSIAIQTPASVNMVVGDSFVAIKQSTDTMEGRIVLSDRIMLTGPFGVTAQSNSESKTIV